MHSDGKRQNADNTGMFGRVEGAMVALSINTHHCRHSGVPPAKAFSNRLGLKMFCCFIFRGIVYIHFMHKSVQTCTAPQLFTNNSLSHQHRDRKWSILDRPQCPGLFLSRCKGNWRSLMALLTSHFLCFTSGLFNQEIRGLSEGLGNPKKFQAKLCISELKALCFSVFQKGLRDNKRRLGEKKNYCFSQVIAQGHLVTLPNLI